MKIVLSIIFSLVIEDLVLRKSRLNKYKDKFVPCTSRIFSLCKKGYVVSELSYRLTYWICS